MRLFDHIYGSAYTTAMRQNIHFRERFLVNYVTHVVQSVFTTYPIPEDDYGEIKHISVNTSRTKSV